MIHVRHITREDNAPYLDRYSLRQQTPKSRDAGFRAYLHHFLSGDGDGHHNHPWRWSLSIVLRGSYTEEYFDVPGCAGHVAAIMNGVRVRTRRVRWFNWIPDTRYHRIVELHGSAWTLFICGPAIQSWGFFMPGRGHVHWKTRLRERGIDV